MYGFSTKSKDFKNKRQKIQELSNKADVFENGQEISESPNYKNNKISKYNLNNRNRKKNYFQMLPDEIILNIFLRLPQRMLKTCYAMVCKHWNKLSDDFSLWKKVDYGRRIIQATDIRKFVTLPVEKLDLSKAILKYYVPLFPVPFKKMSAIKRFSRLQYLYLNEPYRDDKMDAFVADILSACASLKILKLHGIYLNFIICHRISKNKDLKELYCISCIHRTSLKINHVLKIIQQCEKLETVDFTRTFLVYGVNLITNNLQSCLRSLTLYLYWIELEKHIKPIIDRCPNITYLKIVCWGRPHLNILKLIANSLHMLKTFDMSYFGGNLLLPIEDLFLFKEASKLTKLILSKKYTQSDITLLRKILKNVTISRSKI